MIFSSKNITIKLPEWVVGVVLFLITAMTVSCLIFLGNAWNEKTVRIQSLETENVDLKLTILDLNDTLEKQERLIQKRTSK